ncbi:MAG: cyclic nucleotide-binding domain-containing protein [Proteobacteria bacterium]|nr:cyclic nucleotide-binding domain-containing protein [Pseudomonadota bacterium]
MDASIALAAAGWGAFAASSMPLGATLGIALRPSRKITSSAMAFGAGALLFAFTVELFGRTLYGEGEHAVDAALLLSAIGGTLLGGILFDRLNRLLDGHGGFLRKGALIRKHIARERRGEARRLLKALGRVPLFRALPADEIVRLLPDITVAELAADEAVFRAGDEGDCLYVVEAGTVSIVGADGEEIAVLEPGSVFGEMALVTGKPRSATATARGPVRLWRLERDDFDRQVAASPALKEAFRRVTEERLHAMAGRERVAAGEVSDWVRRAMSGLVENVQSRSMIDLQRAELSAHGNAAMAIWLGNVLDCIPGSLVIGMLVVGAAAEGGSPSVAFIAGVFLANLPESMSSAVTMREGGMKPVQAILMWSSLCALTAIGACVGAMLFPAEPAGTTRYVVSAMEGLASGAMLTMIAETMLPEAFEHGGSSVTGISTLLGFLAALSIELLR